MEAPGTLQQFCSRSLHKPTRALRKGEAPHEQTHGQSVCFASSRFRASSSIVFSRIRCWADGGGMVEKLRNGTGGATGSTVTVGVLLLVDFCSTLMLVLLPLLISLQPLADS
uniref:Uncharacterized protein n=1 Tax=Anopheles culicifacies TaxID=139723 RepID=A0A182MQB8_9DIPT